MACGDRHSVEQRAHEPDANHEIPWVSFVEGHHARLNDLPPHLADARSGDPMTKPIRTTVAIPIRITAAIADCRLIC